MNYSFGRAPSSTRLAFLLGTASAGVLGVTSANAQVAEVLITGSLIAGTQSVGVPVTNLGEQDFIETGAINVLELLETVPALFIPPTNSPAFGAGTLHFANNVQIHGLGVGDTLMMQDGRRWPLAGYDGERVDPAIFPQLAVARVDVLTAGASATYGADATAGVINVILKRDIDGAETFLRFGAVPGSQGESVTAAQLYGTSWDTGNVTMTFEHTTQRHITAADLPWYTWNFDSHGFEGFDFRTISASNPGFISEGRIQNNLRVVQQGPDAGDKFERFFYERNGGVGCGGCMSLPTGLGWDFGTQDPGPTTDFSQIGSSINPDNIQEPWSHGWVRPSMESNAFVGTFHQRLTPNLELFGVDWGPVRFIFDGMYSNRRFKQQYPGDQGQARENMSPSRNGYEVPANNPYIPTGLPPNLDPAQGGDLRIHWNLDPEVDTPIVSGGQQNTRYMAGFEFDDLPFNWHGRMDYTETTNVSYGYDRGGFIRNMVSAALGNEVEFTPAFAQVSGDLTFTKPDSVPFLNPFCDGTMFQCNSPTTIAYMQGHRDQLLRSHFSEINVQFDGPIFELPAGPIVVALAYNHLLKNQHFRQEDNTNSEHADEIVVGGDDLSELSNSLIFQANVPLFGPGFNFPLFEAFDLEFGYRFDSYQDGNGITAPSVWTPKIGGNWTLGMGLTLRGSWGKSFRTPKGEEISLTGVGITALNSEGGIESNDTNPMFTDKGCPNGAGGAPLAGTAIAAVNPTCDPALESALGIAVSGNPIGTAATLERSGLLAGGAPTLGPQNAKQFNLGFNFAPGPEHFNGLLSGLVVDATWWRLEYKDLIDSIFQGTGPDDTLSTPFYIPITNPNAPITDPSNAAFWQLTQDLVATPTRVDRRPTPDIVQNTKFIRINTTGNIGEAEREGIDFNARYDWDWSNWGSFHVGASGSYRLRAQLRAAPGSPWVEPLFGVPDHTQIIDGETFVGTNARGNQLEKVRYRAGWTDGSWNFTLFANYFGHHQQDEFGLLLLPECFYKPEYGPGDCYFGSPYYGPRDIFPILSPATVIFDLTFGYNTGIDPANEYLRNINIQFGVTNALDKAPPNGVRPLRSRGTGVSSYDRLYPDVGREVSLTITKSW